MTDKENNKKETFVVRIGPLLKQVLDEQMELIKKATYGVCEASHWEAGEIIAKKVEL